jgi:serine/threonine-protein kinase
MLATADAHDPLQPISRDAVAGYLLRRRVGGDELGVWFDAEQLNLGRAVTIKLLRPHLAKTSPARTAFAREIARLAPLEHPNLMCVLDARREDDLALVLEGAGAWTVADELREGRCLRDTTALAYGRDVARALAYLARMQLGCLLPAPEHVHVFGEGRCRLMTLGNILPFLALAGPRALAAGGVVAPERRHGHCGTRTPSYQVAGLLMHMLTGREPSVGTMREVAASPRVPGIGSGSLSELLRACAQPDPAARPAPGAVADALDAMLRRPPAPLPRSARRRSRL